MTALEYAQSKLGNAAPANEQTPDEWKAAASAYAQRGRTNWSHILTLAYHRSTAEYTNINGRWYRRNRST